MNDFKARQFVGPDKVCMEWGFVGVGGMFVEPVIRNNKTTPIEYWPSFQSTGHHDHSEKPKEIYDQDITSGTDPSSGRTIKAIVYQGPDGKWLLRDVSNETAAYSLENVLLAISDLTVIGNTTENPDWKEVGK